MKKIVIKFLQLQTQMKLLHWQTNSKTEHDIFENFYNDADEIIDDIIEQMQGKYGRIMLGGIDNIMIADYNTLKLNMFLMDFDTFINHDIFNCGLDKDEDGEINGSLDELRSLLNKLKYLISLK